MSELIKHECGIGLIRLRKPLEYYQSKYGTWMYGLQKLYLLMEKQHNRGQDGAGIANVKVNLPPGNKYLFKQKSNSSNPLKRVFDEIYSNLEEARIKHSKFMNDAHWAKENLPFAGELSIGHLRYGTYGNYDISFVHPVSRENNWKSRNLVLAGNFNLTNVDELFEILVDLGQTPKNYSDTVTILENVGHYLDEENQELFRQLKDQGLQNKDISPVIEENLDVAKILTRASKRWDGGYVIAGIIGHGDGFVFRDPWGIRPVFYYYDDEVAVVASERPVIQTVMDVSVNSINEIPPGSVFIVKKSGEISIETVREACERRSCSFERIYFSRGTDMDIYEERKKLGELLTPAVLKTIDYDLENTVFSFIPNTAETAYLGMIKSVEDYLNKIKKEKILELGDNLTKQKLDEIIRLRPRVEKVAVKDVKLRTFISEDQGRDDLVGHVYDITWSSVKEGTDNLVIVDDSIVRGTTLKYSIIKILDRLKPQRIIVVSSSPQIRYPDCYGIDMAKLGDFIAFRATIELLKETGQESIINEVYLNAKAQEGLPKEKTKNCVRDIYTPFTADEISDKIARLLKTPDIGAEIRVVYQSIENLHAACPNDLGDWYFTGNYPTPGGNKVVNTSFINYIEGRDKRAY